MMAHVKKPPTFSQWGTAMGRGKIPREQPLTFEDLYDQYIGSSAFESGYDVGNPLQQYDWVRGAEDSGVSADPHYGLNDEGGVDTAEARTALIAQIQKQRANALARSQDVMRRLAKGESASDVLASWRKVSDHLDDANPNDPRIGGVGDTGRIQIMGMLEEAQRMQNGRLMNPPQAAEYDMGPALQQMALYLGEDPSAYMPQQGAQRQPSFAEWRAASQQQQQAAPRQPTFEEWRAAQGG